MSRRRLWLSLLAAASALLLALVAAGGLLLAHYAPLLARERVEEALARAFQRPVTVESVALSPWLLRVDAAGLTVHDRAAGAPPLLQLGHARVRLSLASLWRREIAVAVRLEDAILRLRPEPGPDRGAAPLALPERLPLGPLTVALEVVQLVRGEVAYEAAGRREVEVRGLEGSLRPRAGGAEVRARAAAVRAQLGTSAEVLDRVEADGEIAGEALRVRRLSATWLGRPFRASGELRGLPARPELAASVAGELDLLAVARHYGAAVAGQGVASVEARLWGPVAALRVSAEATAPEVVVASVHARQVRARGAWEAGRLRVDAVEARLWGGSVSASGGLTASPLEGRASARLTAIDLTALPPALGLPAGVAGRVSGEVGVAGDPRAPEALEGAFTLTAAELRLPGSLGRLGPATAAAAGTFARRVAHVAPLTARWPALSLEARGDVTAAGPQPLTATLEGDLGPLAALLGRRDVAGRGTLQAELRGPWRHPLASGALDLAPLQAGAVRLDALHAAFAYADGRLRVRALEARLGASRIAGSGAAEAPAGWAPGQPLPVLALQADLRAPALHLADLRIWIPAWVEAAGTLHVTASLAGTATAWRGSARVEAEQLRVLDDLAVTGLRATLDGDPAGLAVTAVEGAVIGVPFQGRGRYAWSGRGEATARAGPVRLETLPRLPAGLGLQGTATGQLQAAVQSGRISGSGEIALTGVSAHGVAAGDGAVTIGLQGDRLQVTAGFPQLGASGSLAGPLDRAATLSGALALRDLRLEPLLAAVAAGAAGVSGRLSGEAALAIPLAAPAATRVRATLDPVRLTVQGDEWRNREPVRLRWEDGGLRVDRLALESRLGSLAAQGLVQPSGRLDLALDGHVPLNILAALRPEIWEAGGSLALRASLQGTAAAPRIVGEGRIQDGSLRLRSYPEPLRGLQGQFAVSQSGIRVERLSGALGAGRFEASGSAALQGGGLGAYQARLTGSNLPVALIAGLRTEWDAELELVGAGARGLVRGTATLQRGSYTSDLSLLGLLLSRPAARPAASGPDLRLKVLLDFADRLAVRTELARLRIGGKVSLEGALDAPVLFGTLEARDGTILFRNQQFAVTTARARLTDPRRIDPILDVQARAQIRTYDVTLLLTGRSDDLNVRFSSSPPLPQEDLLSLVVFGVTRQEFGQSAGQILAGEAAQLLVQDLLGVQTGHVAGLDVGFERTDTGTGVVRVRRDVTERARVIFSQALGGKEEQRLRVEYKLLGPLLLAGEQDFRGNYGADVVLRLRFR